ncbi:2-oxo acid dehydrogenase subunit E2 [Weeksellaceae bacterium KMM 9713]|uniref:Dihydrolipoamide acetyltransferase component of pyruvate dehydrogenase complex n=1 Tax=Profundicola chukchiensis TaxID=2961959 RepID=A0A9X4MTX8_9FLAO|nr:dihydrolipoamide acetyltransferase family protein [Profundicola chukchiensis]MDG4944856.1 2-oxo acid dehydrogenase subunit E2 [Profundicola chukchiensis]
MAEYKLLLPAMGEGVMEATVTDWLKNVGDTVEEDESVVEIATDKVDSDVPTPVSGVIKEILVQKDEVAKVGEALAILEVEGEGSSEPAQAEAPASEQTAEAEEVQKEVAELEAPLEASKSEKITSDDANFYSPLVRSIAEKEGISQAELSQIQGSGLGGRVNKDDIQKYLENRKAAPAATPAASQPKAATSASQTPQPVASQPVVSPGQNHEIVEMDRMRKLIANHMVHSLQTAPHVSSFVETDMTKVWNWRNKHKNNFLKREGEKLTFMPIIVEAIVKAIKDFPMINVSVDGDHIIVKKDINIGIATARPDGNLIVPVIKNADQYNLAGLAKKINDLAERARTNNLKPDEIQGGTYTISNIGSFGNILGTPIINQPQVAIMAIGAIEKKPAVVSTPEGDMIGIRQKMYLSHSYDHRVVDGALGGMFVKRVSDYLEKFDVDQDV